MGLINGGLSLTRYRVTEAPPEELTDDYIRERLKKRAFVDIEHSPEEMSLGWVECLDHLKVDFDPAAWRYGNFLAMTLRYDTRKVPARTVARYFAIRLPEVEERNGRPLNSQGRRALKDAVKSELLRRALVNTELMDVAWLYRENEVWLAAAGEKRRELFEELWNDSFGLSLQMLAPVSMGLELLPQNMSKALMDSKAAPIWVEPKGGRP